MDLALEPPDPVKIVMVQGYRLRVVRSMLRSPPGQFMDSSSGLEGWAMSIHKEAPEIY